MAQGDAPSVPRPGEPQTGWFGIDKMSGLNTKLERVSIDDQEFSWLVNMFPVGMGTLKSMPTNGAQIFTHVGQPIIYTFPFNMTSTSGIANNITGQFIAVFFADGTAIDINLVTNAVRTISATPATFFDATAVKPTATQYGSGGIVIVTRLASGNGYFAWDGNLYVPGAAAPTWLRGITPTNMPTGVQGTYVDTFGGHVWVEGAGSGGVNNQVFVSVTGNGADFSSAGSSVFGSNDSFLRSQYTGFKQANGFGYLFADSSIQVISNLQVSGSPAILTFNNQNIDPQVGTSWPSTIQVYGRDIIFANPTGVYKMSGGAADKISDALNGIFQTLDTSPQTGIIPSAAVQTIFNERVYMILVRAFDKITQTNRNFLCMWNGEKWFLGTQDNALTYISTFEISSTLVAYGTDGSQVFPLFSSFGSTSLDKYIQTKLWSGKDWITYRKILREFILVRNQGSDAFNIDGTIDILSDSGNTTSISLTGFVGLVVWVNFVGGIVQWQSVNGNVNWLTSAEVVVGADSQGGTGLFIGLTVHSTTSQFTLSSLGLLYQELAPFGG